MHGSMMEMENSQEMFEAEIFLRDSFLELVLSHASISWGMILL